MPGLNVGLVLGTRRFAAIVGKDKAADILSGTKTFTAPEGRDIGFIHDLPEQEDWAQVRGDAVTTTRLLPAASRAALYAAIADDQIDTDLANLVRSAAVPGIKERIASYLAPLA